MIDIGVRITVAGQKLFDAQCIGRMIRTDEHGVADLLRDQLNTSENKRAHQDLA